MENVGQNTCKQMQTRAESIWENRKKQRQRQRQTAERDRKQNPPKNNKTESTNPSYVVRRTSHIARFILFGPASSPHATIKSSVDYDIKMILDATRRPTAQFLCSLIVLQETRRRSGRLYRHALRRWIIWLYRHERDWCGCFHDLTRALSIG